MAKVSVSYEIDEQFAEIFEQLNNRLGPPKYRIIEVAIQVFNSLPVAYQYILKSNNSSDRQLCLDLIGALEAPIKLAGVSQKKKPSKSG